MTPIVTRVVLEHLLGTPLRQDRNPFTPLRQWQHASGSASALWEGARTCLHIGLERRGYWHAPHDHPCCDHVPAKVGAASRHPGGSNAARRALTASVQHRGEPSLSRSGFAGTLAATRARAHARRSWRLFAKRSARAHVRGRSVGEQRAAPVRTHAPARCAPWPLSSRRRGARAWRRGGRPSGHTTVGVTKASCLCQTIRKVRAEIR